jgi:hypothetical protein
LGNVQRKHEIGGLQSAPRREESSDHRHRHRERRVRHDVEGAARQAEVGHISAHDRHPIAGEALAQDGHPLRMELEGHDARARSEERRGEDTVARAEVQHEVAAADAGGLDEASRPGISEPVPPPPGRRTDGHDAPSRCSS